MRKYYSVPLLFLCIAAALGLFLRWQFIAPTSGAPYKYFLHAHSHVMFLGWVFNVLFLSFAEDHLSTASRPRIIRFFIFLQVLVSAMLISFPIQGYGAYSIAFSTLHTVASIFLIVIFFRLTRHQTGVSLWFARTSLFFFAISTAGPFSLGYIMANGMSETAWYNLSIYYYLHFQYNGCFLFGVISLFYALLEKKGIAFDKKVAITFGKLSAIACIPAYILSTLFAHPGWIFNVIGGVAAVLQLVAVAIVYPHVKQLDRFVKERFGNAVAILLRICFASLVLKSVLQFFSAHQVVADMALTLRPVVIAYLHLVLIGVITFFLLAWYMAKGYVRMPLAKASVVLVTAGFLSSELALVLMPWWRKVIGTTLPSPATVVFTLSVLLVAGFVLFYVAFLKKNDDKNQFSA